jgi:hypothetical protein
MIRRTGVRRRKCYRKVTPENVAGTGPNAHQPRQPRDIRRNPPCLIACQQLAGGSSAGLVLAIHEGEYLPRCGRG